MYDYYNQIKNIGVPTTVQVYYVNNTQDMDKLNPQANVVYIGINTVNDELYVRKLNNIGLIETKEYGKKENVDILSRIERKLDDVQSELNKFFVSDVNERNVKEQPVNATVQPVDNGTNSSSNA